MNMNIRENVGNRGSMRESDFMRGRMDDEVGGTVNIQEGKKERASGRGISEVKNPSKNTTMTFQILRATS